MDFSSRGRDIVTLRIKIRTVELAIVSDWYEVTL